MPTITIPGTKIRKTDFLLYQTNGRFEVNIAEYIRKMRRNFVLSDRTVKMCRYLYTGRSGLLTYVSESASRSGNSNAADFRPRRKNLDEIANDLIIL